MARRDGDPLSIPMRMAPRPVVFSTTHAPALCNRVRTTTLNWDDIALKYSVLEYSDGKIL